MEDGRGGRGKAKGHAFWGGVLLIWGVAIPDRIGMVEAGDLVYVCVAHVADSKVY